MKRTYALLGILPAILFVGCVFLPFTAEAANVYISGNIGTSTSWPSTNTYLITTTVKILSGTTLTIQAGTPVKFATTTTALIVSGGGQLSAVGTPASNITFTASSTVTGPGWNDIEIQSGASSTITNASIKYGGSVFGSSGAGIYVTGGILGSVFAGFRDSG